MNNLLNILCGYQAQSQDEIIESWWLILAGTASVLACLTLFWIGGV